MRLSVGDRWRRACTETSVRVGCSGWQYKHWRGNFYPAALPPARWLEYYATQFDTVEINNSFYRLPEADTFAEWRRRVPRSFVYAVKASRYLTHMKKLKDPGPPVARLFSRVRNLGRRLGPVLYQLPPHWPRNLERLETFLRTLPQSRLHAIEFRDPSWYCDETFDLLSRYHVALCLHDMAGSATGRRLVGPFVYLRLHGPQRYSGRYRERTLEAWADWCVSSQCQGLPVYVYFNNDAGGHAPRDALRLRELCNRYGTPLGTATGIACD
jgi:uncharacterized protein YecE (DUF72 family)